MLLNLPGPHGSPARLFGATEEPGGNSLSRAKETAIAFFKQLINANGLPEKIVLNKSGPNYLNNPVELDHRFNKKMI